MRVPAYLFRHAVSVEPFVGEGSTGPEYGAAVTVRGLWEAKRRLVGMSEGTETVASATFYTDLDSPLGVDDKVTFDGLEYRVVEVRTKDSTYPTNPPHLEVLLAPGGRTAGARG